MNKYKQRKQQTQEKFGTKYHVNTGFVFYQISDFVEHMKNGLKETCIIRLLNKANRERYKAPLFW